MLTIYANHALQIFHYAPDICHYALLFACSLSHSHVSFSHKSQRDPLSPNGTILALTELGRFLCIVIGQRMVPFPVAGHISRLRLKCCWLFVMQFWKRIVLWNQQYKILTLYLLLVSLSERLLHQEWKQKYREGAGRMGDGARFTKQWQKVLNVTIVENLASGIYFFTPQTCLR